MSCAGRYRHHRIYKLQVWAPSARRPSVLWVSIGTLPYASVSLCLTHSSYPINDGVVTPPALSRAVPCLNLALLFNFFVYQKGLPARLVTPQGHRLWALPISQRFILEITCNPNFLIFKKKISRHLIC